MGRPIYVHTEEEDSPSKGDRECVHTWRSFARRLERYPFVLGDPEPTLDANTASVDTRFIVLGTAPQTVDNRQLPGIADLLVILQGAQAYIQQLYPRIPLLFSYLAFFLPCSFFLPCLLSCPSLRNSPSFSPQLVRTGYSAFPGGA